MLIYLSFGSRHSLPGIESLQGATTRGNIKKKGEKRKAIVMLSRIRPANGGPLLRRIEIEKSLCYPCAIQVCVCTRVYVHLFAAA